MATLTLLSTIISRMQRWQFASKVEEQYLVRDLDDALRSLRREVTPPWMLKKSTLRVFDDVLKYPVASDHGDMIYLDRDGDTVEDFSERARFRYTSLQEFFEDPDNRNDLAEIWENGTRYLGVRYKDRKTSSQILDNGETVGNYTASGDASSPTLDQVVYKEGNGSIKFTVTNSAGSATMTVAPTSLSDSNYKRKYFFVSVYLDAAPTSITLRFGNDASNHLSKTVTTQFSGETFKADDWNVLAFDLNEGTVTGTITSTAFGYYAVILTGAATGTYYIDAAYLRSWTLLDYWYASTFNVATVGNSTGNQEYFFNSSEIYSTDSQLIGDSEWVDVVMYDALLTAAMDNENMRVAEGLIGKRKRAWDLLVEKYPDLAPIILTLRWRFENSSMNNTSL